MVKSRNIISALLITVMFVSVFCIPLLTNNEVDAATKKIKIKWNANGGKFAAKKYAKKKSYIKKIKKSKKVGTLPKVKRSGYTFKGWYTKKSGGKKITSKTKIKKKATYYAQWKKASDASTIVGNWNYWNVTQGSNAWTSKYFFYKDGTFQYIYNGGISMTYTKGNYRASNGKIYFTKIIYEGDTKYNDTVFEYALGKDSLGEYLSIPTFRYDEPYVGIGGGNGVKYRRQ